MRGRKHGSQNWYTREGRCAKGHRLADVGRLIKGQRRQTCARCYREQQTRYYKKVWPTTPRRRYTDRDDSLILNSDRNDEHIARALGRTIEAIQVRRCALKKTTLGQKWDEDSKQFSVVA